MTSRKNDLFFWITGKWDNNRGGGGGGSYKRKFTVPLAM